MGGGEHDRVGARTNRLGKAGEQVGTACQLAGAQRGGEGAWMGKGRCTDGWEGTQRGVFSTFCMQCEWVRHGAVGLTASYEALRAIGHEY